MASAEREPITGLWGGAPSGSRGKMGFQEQGQSPWSGSVRGQSPSEVENLLAFGCPTEAANLPHSPYFANSLNPRYL